MKVLLATDLAAPAVNGVVTSVWNLYDELKRNHIDVKILTLTTNKDSYIEGDIYYIKSLKTNIQKDAFVSFNYMDKLIRELIDWKPDIVHTNCEFSTYSFAKKIAKKAGAPLIHTYHTMYEHYVKYVVSSEYLGKKILFPFLKFRLKSSDMIIAPTPKVKRSLIKHHLAKNIRVIPSGIDLSKFDEDVPEETKLALRRRYSIPENKLIIGSLGRLGEEKNFSESLKVIKVLLEKGYDIYYLLVGDGNYTSELKRQAVELGIKDRVVFTGMVDPKEVKNYYQLFDIFLSSTVSETQGLTYIEALVNGCALVVREDEAIENIVIDKVNGRVYKDLQGCIDAICQLIENPENLKEYKANARKDKEKFGKYYFGQSVIKEYYRLLNREEDYYHNYNWKDYYDEIRKFR